MDNLFGDMEIPLKIRKSNTTFIEKFKRFSRASRDIVFGNYHILDNAL